MWRRTACLLAILGWLLCGCSLFQRGGEAVIKGSGKLATETREVGPFTRLALEGLGEVTIQQGSAEALSLTAEDNLLPLITSQVDGDTLRLGFNRPTWRNSVQPTKPIQYTVTVRDLEALELAGSGSLHATSLAAESLLINVLGQGDVMVDHLEAGQTSVRLAGSGTVTLAGRAGQESVQLSGSGQVRAGDLESQTATVDVGGSGEVVVWVRSDLAVNITGAGSVSYFGLPTLSRRDISGTGDINPMGDK